MRSNIENELSELIAPAFPGDGDRQRITEHSIGGQRALMNALRNPSPFRLANAFAPIDAPSEAPRGEEALGGYLGESHATWREHNACALIKEGARLPDLLVDQGGAENFLAEQLKPELMRTACVRAFRRRSAPKKATTTRDPLYQRSRRSTSLYMPSGSAMLST